MKLRILSAAAVGAAALCAAPASATVLLPGTTVIASPDLSPPGTLIASAVLPGTALTFSATLYTAVYQEASGTLDFLYQVARTGPGPSGDEAVDRLTTSPFGTYFVDAQVYAIGGFGPFQTVTHLDTATVSRGSSGNVVTVDWGVNALSGSAVSEIYVMRTNATAYTQGTFGVLDGSGYQGFAFAPFGGVPEPATWGMMLLGFLGIGLVLRRKRAESHIGQLA